MPRVGVGKQDIFDILCLVYNNFLKFLIIKEKLKIKFVELFFLKKLMWITLVMTNTSLKNLTSKIVAYVVGNVKVTNEIEIQSYRY